MPKKIFSKSKISFFVVIAVILLLIFFNFKGWLGIPRNIIYQASSPFLKSFQWLSAKTAAGVKIFTSIKDLMVENSDLKQENQKLWQENSDLKEAARENQDLRQRLALGQIQGRVFILAKIVGFNPELGQYFLIDKGKSEGVSEGLAVVTADNFLIGKVVEAEQHNAKVLLISDSDSIVNALTQDGRVSGIVKGTTGLGLDMEMIPINKEIKTGETVLTSGRNDNFPAGLIVGKISDIILKETDIFQKAAIQPAANFSELESVFVIK
jgi:rod shape-determining protein MreC